MIDTPSRNLQGLNQQTYLRLKLAMSLNMRRQIFLAVCDDLPLRDRLSNRLQDDLIQATAAPESDSGSTYPRLVTLSLSLSSPNPIVQIAQWLSSNPPPRRGKRRRPVPAFQFLGIEALTRQPGKIQRQFLAHLQDIERSLPVLDCSLLFWMPRPWYRMLPQSAEEFWRCRTATFEFMGDPRPSEETAAVASQPTQVIATVPDMGATDDPSPPSHPSDDSPGWTLIHRETRQDKSNQNGNGQSTQLPAAIALKNLHQASAHTSLESASCRASVAIEDTASAYEPDTTRDEAAIEAPLPTPSQDPPDSEAVHQHQPYVKEVVFTANAATEDIPDFETGYEDDQQVSLFQAHLRQLHEQNASPEVLADVYRTLGDIFRDRVEQGQNSLSNLQGGIQAYEQVLIWLPESSPLWPDVLNDLGNLHWMLSRQHPEPENAIASLQQGIQAYEMGLVRLQADAFAPPLDNRGEVGLQQAMIYNNLGAAYADLARYQEPVENLQRSIGAYQEVLSRRLPDMDPGRYASTQNNLGTTLWNLAQHEHPKENLRQAIAAYTEALAYCSSEEDPTGYGMIQNNLGTAYWNLAQFETPQEWLNKAVFAYQLALKYRTPEESLTAHAATQNNLGTAYWHLASQATEAPAKRQEFWKKAIAAYDLALHVVSQLDGRSPISFDLNASHTNLGLAHYQMATDAALMVPAEACSHHLELALQHHLSAVQGWKARPSLRQAALGNLIKTIRTLYRKKGLEGQNLAFSMLPAELLPEVLPKL